MFPTPHQSGQTARHPRGTLASAACVSQTMKSLRLVVEGIHDARGAWLRQEKRSRDVSLINQPSPSCFREVLLCIEPQRLPVDREQPDPVPALKNPQGLHAFGFLQTASRERRVVKKEAPSICVHPHVFVPQPFPTVNFGNSEIRLRRGKGNPEKESAHPLLNAFHRDRIPACREYDSNRAESE